MNRYVRSSDLLGRFISYGLPIQAAVNLQADILRWERNSGPKWTVDRLKSLKQDFIRLRAGHGTLTWVRKNRQGGWYGVWGFLRRYADRSLKCFEVVLNCLMAYSSFIPSEPTKEHIEAARNSIEAEPVYVPGNLKDDLVRHAKSIFGTLNLGPTQPLVTFAGKVSTKSPVWGGPSVKQYDMLEEELRWMEDPYHKLFLNRHYGCYGPVLEGISNLSISEPLMGLSGEAYHLSEWGPFQNVQSKLRPPFMEVLAGSLVPLTKDGGWKVRWIASPYRIHQLALHPLGSALFRELETVPWDCTFDQSKPYKHVREHLLKGGSAFCVDLSSATDHFPLDLQLAVLGGLFGSIGMGQIELFGELSRCAWDARKYGIFRWKKGQPMGLYPSFPAFALTHGVLLDALSGGIPGRFYVLGDDVIILHKPTYERYLQTLDVLGCPHNPAKSLCSDQVAEFAGKLIFPERVVSAFKWRDPNSNNFMELMRTFGQKFAPMLRKRESVVYKKMARLLPPYGCNHSWGSADLLEKVVYLTEMFISALPEARGKVVHTSFLHRLAEILRPSRPGSLFFKVCPKWFQDQAVHLDESVHTAFKNTPFRALPGDRGVLADVLALSDLVRLPTAGPKERVDQSLLEWYEKVLGLADNN